MDNKKLLLLASIILVIVLLIVVLFAFDTPEEQPEEIVAESEPIVQEIGPDIEKAIEIRETKRMIDGELEEVGDDYFVISQSFYDGDEDLSLMSIEEQRDLEFRYEYITVRPTENAEISEISSNSGIKIPLGYTKAIDKINYLYENYGDEYIIRICFATDPIVEEEIEDEEEYSIEEVEVDYIEWSVFPLDIFQK